jgi:hypothetical protein
VDKEFGEGFDEVSAGVLERCGRNGHY